MAVNRLHHVCNSIALHGFQIVRKVHKYSQSTSFDIELIAIIIIGVPFFDHRVENNESKRIYLK